MRVSAGLLALAISALRNGDTESAAKFVCEAADSPDISALLTEMTGIEYQASTSSVAGSLDHALEVNLQQDLSRRAQMLSDPVDDSILSIADDGVDEDEGDDTIRLSLVDLDAEDEDDESESTASTSSTPIVLTLTVG